MQKYAMEMKINVFSESVDILNCDILTLGFFSDERPPRGNCGRVDWRLNGLISHLIAKGKIEGAFMEKVLIAPNHRIPSSKILLIGLGDLVHLTYEKLYTAGHTISKTLSEIKSDNFAFDIPGIGKIDLDISKMSRSLISGFFDFLAENSRLSKGPVSTSILVEEDHLSEIILGMRKFKSDFKSRAKIDITKTKKSEHI